MTPRQQRLYDNLHIATVNTWDIDVAYKTDDPDNYRIFWRRSNEEVRKWTRAREWRPVCNQFADVVRLKVWGLV